ncbi:transposase [Candidatus Omnitrophota bacterium]
MIPFKRIYYESAVYHVISRGNNKHYILKNEEDKISFLLSLAKYKERFSFRVYGFVLMDNHIHMIMEVNEKHTISKVMQAILLSYSRKYRSKYGYVGHLWQGRFNSIPMLKERYILELIDYIHHNPVRAKMVTQAIDYIWSSARFYAKLENKEIDETILIDEYGHFYCN